MADTVADVVRIIFEAGGHQEVSRAFETIEQRMAKFEKASTQSVSSGVRDRIRAAQQERKEKEAIYAGLFKEIDAKEKAALKSADAAAKARAKAEANAARERLRSEEDLARQQQRIRDNSARQAGRIAEQQAAAEIRASERAARERTRIAERAARDIADRNKRIAGGIVGTVGGATSRVLGGASMLAGTAMAIGGGISFADAIRNDMAAETSATGLINSISGGAPFTAAGIIDKAKAIQTATHINKGAVIESMRGYVATTGSAELIQDDKSLMQIARLSKATGAEMGDLMKFAGLVKAQNTNLSNAGIVDMLRAGAAQGMSGAIEIKDLAAIAGRITASRGAYSTNQTSAQKQLLGLAQVVFPTAGSTDMAATIVSRFSADALKNQDRLKGMGLVDKNGNIADPDKIITGVLAASKGNLGTIQKSVANGGFGFGLESIKLFEQLAPSYREAYEKAGGDKNAKAATAAAQAAITGQITKITGATMTEGEVDERVSRQMATRAEKIEGAMQRFQDILAEKGLPLFDKFVSGLDRNLPQIERFLDRLAGLAEWFANNPFEGLGALVLANVVKDLGSAAIGEGVKKALIAMLPAGGAGAPTPTGAPPGSPAPGYLAAAALTIGMAVAVNESGAEGGKIGKASVQSALGSLSDTEKALKAGQITPAQADRARRDVAGFLSTQKSNADIAHQALDLASVPLSILPGETGNEARKAINQTHAADEVVKQEGAIVKAMQSLEKAIQESSRTASSPGGGSLADPNNPTRNQAHSAPRVAQ